MNDESYNLGERIKTARQERGLSQLALAKKLRIGKNRLSNWENGVNRPSVAMIRQICLALNISPCDLLDVHITGRKVTERDYKIIKAYHSRKEVQYAVDLLLGLLEDA